MLFDIVFCLGPNDISKIQSTIDSAKNSLTDFRNIYVISYDKNIVLNNCIIIDENIFPFNLTEIEKIHGKRKRNGWYLQQLLKLYAGSVIPGILNTYLVIDADTYFLKPVTFIENGVYLFNPGTEYHVPYFTHMEKLHPTLKKMNNHSGISHHMIFDTSLVEQLFDLVIDKPFWKVFLEQVTDYDGSGASEYEIYFNYLLMYHPDKIKIRKLKWTNSKTLTKDYDYISIHWYL
jgi:hypothetical protein